MAADPKSFTDDLADRARDYMVRARQAQPDVSNEDLVDAATLHLKAICPDPWMAVDIALGAYAALQGERSRAYFDLRASTKDLIFLVDTVTGQRRAASATDLLRILGPRLVARPGPGVDAQAAADAEPDAG